MPEELITAVKFVRLLAVVLIPNVNASPSVSLKYVLTLNVATVRIEVFPSGKVSSANVMLGYVPENAGTVDNIVTPLLVRAVPSVVPSLGVIVAFHTSPLPVS